MKFHEKRDLHVVNYCTFSVICRSVAEFSFFNDRKKLSQFLHNALFQPQKTSETEKMTDAFKLFRTNGRNVPAKKTNKE